MITSSGELKYCPFRIHGETRLSATVNGESFYNEYFMPCTKDECICYQKDNNSEYCYRDNLVFKRKINDTE